MDQPRIIEQFILSKAGDLESCEDHIHISDKFIAVVDGVTSKAENIPSGLNPGGLVAEEISSGLHHVESHASCSETLTFLSEIVRLFLQKNNELTAFRPAAAAIIFSIKRRELWQVGDCKYAYDGVDMESESEIDSHAAAVRAAYNRAQIISGKNIDDLKKRDEGRNVIMPMLKMQHNFLNRVGEHPFGYSCFNGEQIPDELQVIHNIPDSTRELTLASDGYPRLLANLAESEEYLKKILHSDPLCIREHIATKGLQPGQVSFDDRAYLRIGLK